MESTKKIWIWAAIATILVILAVYITTDKNQAVVEGEPVIIEEEAIVIAPDEAATETSESMVQGTAEPLADETGAQPSEEAVFESAITEESEQMDDQLNNATESGAETPTAN